MSLLDEEIEEDFTGRIRRTKNGRPYVLADPDWSSKEAARRGFTVKPTEPRGPSKIETRVTTYVSCLEDTYALGQWAERMVALGFAMRPQLVAAIQRLDLADEKAATIGLDEAARVAKEAANWKLKADLGTDFHDIATQYDRDGRTDWSLLSPESAGMLFAYSEATKGWEYAHVEQGMVNDELETYGTPDRLTWVKCDRCMDEGNVRKFRDAKIVLSVDDIKTGRIDYGQQKMALQMAAYSMSKLYDPDTGVRTELPICRHQARIIHVPYGQGTATVYPIDLEPAIDALTTLVPAVRKFRSRTTWFGAPTGGNALSSGVAAAWSGTPPEVT